MKKTLYHGTFSKLEAHIGFCLTPSESSASSYAQGGDVWEIELDISGLSVVTIDGVIDRDNQQYVGDDQIEMDGVDIIIYDDEDLHNRQHETYRIVSKKGLDRLIAAIAAAEKI